MEKRLLEDIFQRMKDEGFGENTEQYEICKRSIQFLNFSYKRSEELEEGKTVDCSTLTSQSHWEGALIGMPFVADNQRRAVSGKSIKLLDEMIPADVLVKYPSLEASPDKTWNHVGLYLGKDLTGKQWLVESTSKTGVRLSTVEAFNPQGGIKRFTLSSQPFTMPFAHEAINLGCLVPKFGRLGVRQYRKTGGERPIHKGLDIYVSAETPVCSTVEGAVSLIQDNLEQMGGVEITGQSFIIRYLMLGGISVQNGDIVKVGDLLGYIVFPSEKSDIMYSSAKEGWSHLHLETEIVPAETSLPTEIVIGDKRFANHLYLSKLGVLPLPFRV